MTPQEYVENLGGALATLDVATIDAMADILCEALNSRRTVFCFGNGGSASTASHLAMDLAKLTVVPGAPSRLKTVALTDSPSAITMIGNDFAYEEVFAEQLRTLLEPGDVLLGISTSGTSRNVLRALEYGLEHGATALGITGIHGCALRDRSTHALTIASESVQHIEDLTLVAGHVLCMLTREKIAQHVGEMTAHG